MTLKAAVAKVTKYLQKHHTPKGWKAEIYTWNAPELGPRVAEVSFSGPTPRAVLAGESYMQSDVPYGLAVCAQVERCIIAAMTGEYYDEERDRLAWLLRPKKKGE